MEIRNKNPRTKNWQSTSRSQPCFYEINFNRYFYKYIPPRPLEEIESDIRGIEKDIVRMLAEVTGGATTEK